MERASTRPTRLIALMNQKGGVGKTTTTVTLAAAFARSGRPTLVVDLDPQAHASLHLGVDPGAVTSSVYDVLLDPDADPSPSIVEVAPNLFVMPAQTDLAAAETELANEPERHRRLLTALKQVMHRFEFVLFDCPPSLGLLTLNGLVAAREILIPMQAHFLALQGVGKLLETVKLVTANVNPRLRVTGVILCMHDTSSTHTNEVVADLEAFLASQRTLDVPWKLARVLRPAVRRNIKLAECPSFGQTIFDYAPTAPGASDYRALADTLLREWDAMLDRRSESSTQPPASPPPSQSPPASSTPTASPPNDPQPPAIITRPALHTSPTTHAEARA